MISQRSTLISEKGSQINQKINFWFNQRVLDMAIIHKSLIYDQFRLLIFYSYEDTKGHMTTCYCLVVITITWNIERHNEWIFLKLHDCNIKSTMKMIQNSRGGIEQAAEVDGSVSVVVA